jgi:hypothetical protein
MILPDLGSWSGPLAALFSGFFAWMIARERRLDRHDARKHGRPTEPPKLPGIGPVVLILGGLLFAGYQGSREALLSVLPASQLAGIECGSECTQKPGCKCSGSSCNCTTVDKRPETKPQEVKPPPVTKPKGQKPHSSMASGPVPMAGKMDGWSIEPLHGPVHFHAMFTCSSSLTVQRWGF